MQLHMSIWKHCKNDTLLSLLKNLNEKYAFVCNNIIAKSANPISYLLIQDHLDLITELEAKNLPAIKQLIASHWGKGVLFE
jgi:DNA-binding GntR family transcriptional regulator